MKQFNILLGILLIFSSCQQKSKKIESNVTDTSDLVSDTSFIRKALEKSRIDTNDRDYEILFNKDTLKIVSVSDFFWYPFGKHKNIKDIAKQIDNCEITNVLLYNPIEKDSVDVTLISTAKSKIKFFYDIEQLRQQIVSAEINDGNFHFNNKIKIGITKKQFLNLFFNNPPKIPVNIIKFISAVDGINHYYYFKNDKLIKVEMRTDYMFGGKN